MIMLQHMLWLFKERINCILIYKLDFLELTQGSKRKKEKKKGTIQFYLCNIYILWKGSFKLFIETKINFTKMTMT